MMTKPPPIRSDEAAALGVVIMAHRERIKAKAVHTAHDEAEAWRDVQRAWEELESLRAKERA